MKGKYYTELNHCMGQSKDWAFFGGHLTKFYLIKETYSQNAF